MTTQATPKIDLAYPISHEGATISSVTLRRPTVSDVMSVNREGGGPAEHDAAVGVGTRDQRRECAAG